NLLLAKTKEAEKGFAKAAEKAEAADLKDYFQAKSNLRNVFALEISTSIRALGVTEDPKENYLGDIHRLWMDVKTALFFKNDEALLEECERGEQYSLEDYDKILVFENLPASVKNVLESKRKKVAETINTLEKLD
ncbi:MAG: PA2169 family four-helix-bundle protein, partial [Saprospiraceae bacterium]